MIALIKPQFELSKEKIGKNGIVTEAKYRDEAVKEISNWLERKNWKVIETMESCITGAKGNHEYFIYTVREKI